MIKIITTAITIALLSSSAFAAEKLTIINSGSKTGGFSMQSTAYAADLDKDYNVTLVSPGDRCVAVGALLPKIKGPVLMPWATDYVMTAHQCMYVHEAVTLLRTLVV